MADILEPLYGNGQLKTYISGRIAEGQLPHALIFEGPEGSGKLTVALMTAAMLCPEYADKIQSRLSLDVTVHELEAGKKSIGVALIRDIRESAYIKPQELPVRVFIIRTAHLMTTEAQNALLKIFEEPPKGVHFFLLTENASALLPTVRSRAPVLRMSVFDDEELISYVVSTNQKAQNLQKNSPETLEMLIRSCSGSIGQAEAKLGAPNADAEKLRERTRELIDLLSAAKRDGILLFFVKSKLDRSELDELLLNLAFAIRDMLKTKYGTPRTLLYFTSVTENEETSAEFARITLINLYSAIEELRATLTVNVNAEAFAVRIADVLCEALAK